MKCGGGQVLFIQKGNYGKVKLDGLAVATMRTKSEGQTMMESFGNWDFSNNYIDEKATPEQRKALEAIVTKVLDQGASKKTETRYVAITRKIEAKIIRSHLDDTGKFPGHLFEGSLGGTPKIANPPGADPIHKEYAQGRTSTMTYNDAEQNWSWTTRTICLGRSRLITSNTKNSPPVLRRRWDR